MDRRAFITIVGGGILAAPRAVEAQQPPRIAKVGYLAATTRATVTHLIDAFRQGLRELGHVEEGASFSRSAPRRRELNGFQSLRESWSASSLTSSSRPAIRRSPQ